MEAVEGKKKEVHKVIKQMRNAEEKIVVSLPPGAVATPGLQSWRIYGG